MNPSLQWWFNSSQPEARSVRIFHIQSTWSSSGSLLEYPLENGGSILVAVEAESGPVTRGWGEDRSRQIAERATETFEAAVGKVRSAADAMLASLSGLNSAPDDITVEFAIQLNAEAGVCIATLAL